MGLEQHLNTQRRQIPCIVRREVKMDYNYKNAAARGTHIQPERRKRKRRAYRKQSNEIDEDTL